MLATSIQYQEKIKSSDRSFALRLTHVGSSTVLTGTTIQNMTLDEIVCSTDSLSFGCACSNKLTVNLINAPTDIDYTNAIFEAQAGLFLDNYGTVEWIDLGTFYVTEVEANNGYQNLKFTAYDGFCKMNKPYVPNVTMSPNPAMLRELYDDFKEQLQRDCGIVLKDRTLLSYGVYVPNIEMTYAQAAGYIAGFLGGFARFSRTGELEIVSYAETSLTISRNLQYMGGFKRYTDKPLTITSIVSGTQGEPVVKGDGVNGTSIRYENPFIHWEVMEEIWSTWGNFTYTPCQVKWRGDPAIQAGDMVTVIDRDDIPHTILVMSQSLKLGGGCNATIECKGNSDTQSEFSTRFESVAQKVERFYSTLEQQILDATNAITGNSGGYVMLHDSNEDGKPDEILIMDTESIETSTSVWRWNKAGLGYATSYNGPYKTAITADGKINADFITVGTLSANRLAVENFDANNPTLITDYIRFEDGTMRFGKGDSTITLKLEHDQVAFYRNDTRIAYFGTNSFEIENLTDGKIRFQNFGFIPRESGNLSFTLLNS